MSNRTVKLALHAADPRCHWCRRETKLTNIQHIKGQPDPLMATVDHVISRMNPERWVKKKDGERRKVLACYECNARRSQEEIASLSKEEILRRCQGFSLSPKGKPIVTNPCSTLIEVLERFKDKGIEFETPKTEPAPSRGIVTLNPFNPIVIPEA